MTRRVGRGRGGLSMYRITSILGDLGGGDLLLRLRKGAMSSELDREKDRRASRMSSSYSSSDHSPRLSDRPLLLLALLGIVSLDAARLLLRER